MAVKTQTNTPVVLINISGNQKRFKKKTSTEPFAKATPTHTHPQVTPHPRYHSLTL